MQLSSQARHRLTGTWQARKVVATGLALSTVLWGTLAFVPTIASAAVHSEGCLVLSGGIVWMITGGTRRGYTSAEVFQSYGYNFSQVVAAVAEDTALPVGPIMIYADNTLVKGPSDPLVYVVTNGQKRPFVSGDVFTGRGYSFANIQTAPSNTFADLPTGANVDNTTSAHSAGVLVISNGAVWQMTTNGRKGFPSMGAFLSYGYMLSHVVAANAADLASPDQGAVATRPACSGGGVTPTPPPVSGNVNVSLASDNPGAGTLVAGQATADLAHFTFSGTGTVTAVSFQRIGVSADSTLANVYLYEGSVRLTDAASVTSGSSVNFSNGAGLFKVDGSRTLSVMADIAASTSGQTIGVKLNSVTLASGTAAGTASGNLFTIASATLAGLTFGAATPATGSVDPALDMVVYQVTATITTRNVNMNRFALREIGSIKYTDLANLRLMVDGGLVSTVAALDGDGYVTFTGFSKLLNAGAHTIKVLANSVGGANRTFSFSLRNASDIGVVDSQYSVNVLTSTTTPITSGTVTLNPGAITVQKDASSATGNVTLNSSAILLGTYNLTATGEDVKISTLSVQAVMATNSTAATTIRNGYLTFNGVQYGSTTNMSTSAGTSYTTNYVVKTGPAVVLKVYADIYNGSGVALAASDTITIRLKTGSANGQGQSSLATSNVPTADSDANQVTVVSGTTITTAAATNYPAQTVVVPQAAYKLASMTVTGSNAEDVNVDTILLAFTSVTNATFSAVDLTNVYVKWSGLQESTKATVAATGNTWSVSRLLPKNGVVTVEVFANIGSTITAADSIKSTMTVSGTTATSGQAATSAAVDGQTITYNTGTFTATKDASTPNARIVADNQTVDAGVFKLAAVNDSYSLTQLVVTVANATNVQNALLVDGVTVLQTLPGAATVTFNLPGSGTGSFNVPANANKTLKVQLQLGTTGYQAGTSGASLLSTVTSGKAIASSTGVEANITESDPAGNALAVYAAIPTINLETLGTSILSAGVQAIAKFTISTNGTGTVAWKQVMLNIAKVLAPTVASATLFDVTGGGNSQVTAAVAFQNGSAGGADATLCSANNTTCELLISVGTNADDSVEQQVSGAKTYEVRATIGGTLATGNYVSTQINTNSTVAATSAAFQTNKNTGTANTLNFIWSDISAQTHSTASLDWVNDYKVPGLPLSSQTLTK